MTDTTPSGVRIIAQHCGETRNITEGVQVLYDHLIQSMDWTSGFLTVEDVAPIVELAQYCGFTGYEAAIEYMKKAEVKDKQAVCEHKSWRKEPYGDAYYMLTCVECGIVNYQRASQ